MRMKPIEKTANERKPKERAAMHRPATGVVTHANMKEGAQVTNPLTNRTFLTTSLSLG